MKRTNILYKVIFWVTAVCTGVILPGCNMVYEDLEPCPRGIRLRLYYDYNMKYADALPVEMKNVSVYVFDPVTGAAVDQLHVPVGEVKEREFEINLDHLPVGRYDFLIWGYGDSKEHFTVKPDKNAEDLLEHHTCLMSEDDDNPGHQSSDIGRLFHGKLENADCTKDDEIVTYEVPLVKDTNVVRLVLQHISGEYLDPSKFDITLESDNGHMDHNNDLIDGHNRIYHPWEVNSGTTDMGHYVEDARAITSASALVAEHTIGRIVKDKGVKLRVRNAETGTDIINIPFVDYALLVKGNYNKPMSDQEYLDRQDEYNMVFFLDDGLRWIDQYIYINSWRLVLQHEDL